jgi:hypothetical protein
MKKSKKARAAWLRENYGTEDLDEVMRILKKRWNEDKKSTEAK